MDIGNTVNATGRTTPVWGSPLRILAIVLPLAAGLVCSFIDQSLLLVSWIPFTVAVASAALLRSWWAVLIAPVALSIGTLLGLLAAGSGPNDITDPGSAASLTLFVLLALVPSATGAAIGAPLGKETERLTAGTRHTHG